MKSFSLSADVIERSFTIVQDTFRQHRPLILARAGKTAFNDKRDGSPVTETDIEIERSLQAAIAREFPNLPVFGEETGYPESLPETFWVIDPIDGTKSFIENIPTFTSMAALIQHGTIIASSIYNPSTNDMFTARIGEGAYKNDLRLDIRDQSLPATAYCKAEFVHDLDAMLHQHSVTCVPAPTGGGYGFTMVASNQVAARFQLKGRGGIHDYAPGVLLVQEAGGVIVPILDEAYTYTSNSFVACHPALEATLREHVPQLRQLETR